MKQCLVAWLCVGLLPTAGLAQETPMGTQAETPPAAETPVAEAHEEQATPASPMPAETSVVVPTPTNSAVQTPEQLAAQTGFRLGASLGSTVGHGTFVAPEQVGFVDMGVSVRPSYSFRGPGDLRLLASASASAAFELTPPDSATGRRFDWADLRFGLSAPGVYELPVVGASVTPSLSLTLPAALRSFWSGSLGTLGASVSVRRSLGHWMLGYHVGGSRGFHSSAAVGVEAPSQAEDVRRDATGHALDICRAGQELCASGGINTAWSLSQSLGLTWIPTERWSASVDVGLSHRWRYAVTDAPD
ncbi:MAG: hypothetical protein L0Y66_18055, partial [Myxococcaceae bacterium]|nr:hypothetical protein [Myxococcaceae bacterium]MCI0673842.1 hypothetical protein [Myxococcaceae bacterium]